MAGTKRGLTLRDYENMTIGMLLDYFTEWDEISNPNDENKIVEASQDDFDKF